jgi:hypothetical protein
MDITVYEYVEYAGILPAAKFSESYLVLFLQSE